VLDISFSSMVLHVQPEWRSSNPESIYDVEDEELIPVMRRFLENRRRAAQESVAAA